MPTVDAVDRERGDQHVSHVESVDSRLVEEEEQQQVKLTYIARWWYARPTCSLYRTLQLIDLRSNGRNVRQRW